MEMYGMKKIPLPLKEYEQELKNEETGPELLYDFSSMTAWYYLIPNFKHQIKYEI